MQSSHLGIVPDKYRPVGTRDVMLVVYRHITHGKRKLQIPMLTQAHRIAVAQAGTPVVALIAAEIAFPLQVEFAPASLQGKEMTLKKPLSRRKPPPQLSLRIKHLKSILVPIGTRRPPGEHIIRID